MWTRRGPPDRSGLHRHRTHGETAESHTQTLGEELLAELDDVATDVFAEADPQELWTFYKAIGLEIRFTHQTRIADVRVRPSEEAQIPEGFSGGSQCVRRGT